MSDDAPLYIPKLLGLMSYIPLKNAELLEHVREVLDTYRAQLPLSLRQAYYILVGRFGYEKSDLFYQRLGDLVNRGRRGGLIPWDAIRDDGVTESWIGGGYDDLEDFREAVLRDARYYSRDLHATQPKRVFVACEAGGMVPQIENACAGLPIIVHSSSGTDSVTAKYDLAKLCMDQPSVVLHVGDFDPSGLVIYNLIKFDVGRMIEDLCIEEGRDPPEYECKRIAVLPEHIAQFGLLTGRVKPGDNSRKWYPGLPGDPDGVCEAESLPPDVLARLVRAAVLSELDLPAIEATRELERQERERAIAAVAELSFDDDDPDDEDTDE